MMNVLVTGGAGFIGSNFIRYLLEADTSVQVINLDCLSYSGSLENLRHLPDEDRYTFVKGDICDFGLVAQLLREYKIDTVVHFAAESHVDRSIAGPGKFVQTNIQGTYTLLEALRQHWLLASAVDTNTVRFHHISTDEVYGSLAPDEPPWSEACPYNPHSPYAASKAASDHLVRAYGHTYGLPFTLTNCTNNYGPYQFPEKLIPLVITNALAGKTLPLYGDGLQIRDWLHVEDHCEAIHLVLGRGQPGSSYNLGGGNQPTNLEMVGMICEFLDELRPDSKFKPHRQLIRFVKDRPGHDLRYALDAQKIKHELGWKPRHGIRDGVRNTVVWYLDHAGWIEAIRKRKEYRDWLEENYTHRRESGEEN